MNQKKLLTYYLYFLIVALVGTNIYIPQHYHTPYPKPLGPTFSPRIKDVHVRAIDANQPEFVLIGDSTLEEGVDQTLLTRELNKETYKLSVRGSATAAWYLVMKNVVMKSAYRPKYIVILFRDTMLTVPYFRTTGRYLELLDDYAGKNEPVLNELAFINQMNPVEKIMEQYLPLYGMRWDIRTGLEHRLRYMAPSIINCQKNCAEDAVHSIFGRELDTIALNQMIEDSGDSLYSPDEMDFDRHIDTSFLPIMIDLAKDNNSTLILVRTGTLNFPTAESEPQALKNYIQSLGTYLAEHDNVYFLDLAYDARVDSSFFADSVHFNAHGKELFTSILANDLQSLSAGK